MKLLLRSIFNRPSKQSRQTPRAQLVVERLENRTVPSITFSAAGNSGVASLLGGPGAEDFQIRLKPTDASTIEFSDNVGASFVDAALSGITAVNVSGLQGSDTLILDASNGLLGKASGLPISFDGGVGLDVLAVVGTPDGTVTETFTAGSSPGTGTLAIGNGTVASTITLTNVSAIRDTMTADTLTINGNDNNNRIHFQNGPVINGFKTDTVRIQNVNVNENVDDADEQDMEQADERRFGNLVSVGFANKTNVIIGGLGGDDLILAVAQPAVGLQTLTFDGGTGTNVLAANRLPYNVSVGVNQFQIQETDPDAIFIEALYQERLERTAQAPEVAGWLNVLHGSGRTAVAQGIEESLEARKNLERSW